MVFVCFHRHDFVVMSISDALNLLFYGIIDVSSQQLLAIFRHKDDVYFETIFTPVMPMISVIHKSPQCALMFTIYYCIIALVKQQRKED